MLAEKFANQNGIHWHKWISQNDDNGFHLPLICEDVNCEYHVWKGQKYFPDNPTFSHPEEVLAVCQKWDDYRAFIVKLVSELKDDGTLSDMVKSFIETYITTPNKLLEAAVEWREK